MSSASRSNDQVLFMISTTITSDTAGSIHAQPVYMTTRPALFAGIPLVIATGPGTELRRPLGITIIGGLFVSQILTLYTTPVIYLLIDRLRRRSEPRPLAAPAE